jgi:hypothetical protein
VRRGLAIALALAAAPVSAQQPPPIGIATPGLADGPWVFDSAEQHRLKVSVIAEGFARPFAIEFLPGGDLLIVERGVGLRLLRGATGSAPVLDDSLVPGVPQDTPDVFSYGVTDIALHPNFSENGWIYFTFNGFAPLPEGTSPLQRPGFFKVLRGKWAVVRGEESTEVVLYAQVAPVVEGPLEVSAIVPESVEVVVAGRKRDLFKLRSQPPVVRRRFDDAVPQRVRISLQPSDVEFPLGVQATAREVRPRIVTITLRAPGSASAPATAPGGK